MVATTIALPNVRKLFIPDPGHYIFEADQSGAEAQVTAWDAGDEDLKDAFRAGLNVHIKNAHDVYPTKVKGWSDEAIKATDHPGGVYYMVKRFVHATHNGGKPKGIAQQVGSTVAEAATFQKIWFGLHPKIVDRFQYIEDCLHGRIEGNQKRTVRNRFGYRMVFFDRIENVFTEALTWIQQSTVGITTARGGLLVREECPWVKLLLQVHDSLVGQFLYEDIDKIPQLGRTLHKVIVPYDDPLCIPWGLTMSKKSWGHGEKTSWEREEDDE